MNTTTIICPHCKKPFEISDAIQHQIEDELLRAKTEQSESLRKEYDTLAESKVKEAVQNAVAEAKQEAEHLLSKERQAAKLELDTVIPMMNVIRRILEYYFMQLCGYDGTDIRKRVLDVSKDKFMDPLTIAGGLPDNTKFLLAQSMLSYINTSSVGISDGMHYVDGCADIDLYKTVFKLIFEALKQEQHYKMMMGEEA